ncbi:hypothetical protein FHW69_003336 [Luteibacter sp. Sphag1AF]|uniref:hypothetical protein n=1 Tax=Luteibacter sp. Sphag1AF TaxID=2587031 RepID=UPI00160ACF51|nr:hypothetical protein [Luteibacter sp. Sphag1AF]MBB3228694.1 hypothetical protein [Luteibacter sp. Sphag1AF]
MHRLPLRRVTVGAMLCVAVLLGACHREPTPLANGQPAETREQFEERANLLTQFNEPLPADVSFDDAQAREFAVREDLPTLRARLANTGVTYDFQWRAHESPEALADIDRADLHYNPVHSGRSESRLIRPGVWVNLAPSFSPTTPDDYVIRTFVTFRVTGSFWNSTVHFHLPAAHGAPAAELTCTASDQHRRGRDFGYCTTPAPHLRYNVQDDAALLDRLARLQNEGPSPERGDALLHMSQITVGSGAEAEKIESQKAQSAQWQEVVKQRERNALPELIFTYGLIIVVLGGILVMGAWLALKRRRGQGTRTASKIFGFASLAAAATCFWLAGKTGPWGLILSLGLLALCAAFTVSGLIALAGTLRRDTE